MRARTTSKKHVDSVIIPDCGHYPAEEAPAELLDALASFLSPYRNGEPTKRVPRLRSSEEQPLAAREGVTLGKFTRPIVT